MAFLLNSNFGSKNSFDLKKCFQLEPRTGADLSGFTVTLSRNSSLYTIHAEIYHRIPFLVITSEMLFISCTSGQTVYDSILLCLELKVPRANDCEEGGDPAYQGLQFCASQHTDRMYIYDQVDV